MGKNGPSYFSQFHSMQPSSGRHPSSRCSQRGQSLLYCPAKHMVAVAFLACLLHQATPAPILNASYAQCPRQCICSNLTTSQFGVPSITIDCSRGGFNSFLEFSNQMIKEMALSSANHQNDSINYDDGTVVQNESSTLLPRPGESAINDGGQQFNDSIFTVIDLSFNNLSSLQSFTKIDWKALPLIVVQLNLSRNNIEEMNNTSSFSNLVSLDLSNNRISSFDVGQIVKDMPNLKHLHLQNNKIENISKSNDNSSNLVFLDLSFNHMHNLPANPFSNFPALISLDLKNNRITSVDHFAFQGLPKLQSLSLAFNDIISLDYPVFQNTSLNQLMLNNLPQLTSLHFNTFLGLTSLQRLNLSQNPSLHFVNYITFAPLESLTILDLSDSGVNKLSELTFHNNHHLKSVLLQGLSLSCECPNAWLVREVNNTNSIFPNISSAQCFIPNTNQTSSIIDAEFHCDNVSSIPVFHHRLHIDIGSMLTLPCKHHQTSGDNVLMWITPRNRMFYHQHLYPNASDHLLSQTDVQSDSSFHSTHYWHHSNSYNSQLSSYKDRIQILSDGSLYIDYILRSDAGLYKCIIKNANFNSTSTVDITFSYKINQIKIYAIIVGFLCALGFFTLNLVYVIISWLARRLINKRRREHIRQMLENLNSYKSTQITRIYENYTGQLNRVRNTYHFQRDRLHKNYTMQVDRVKRGCSDQVEKVRENYNTRLTQLREYSSNQIMQIREIANTKIGHVRDYGSLQLDRLREAYKLQQQHVLKLLETMNLDNCRTIVETECMRTESMMYDLDLLSQEDERTESPFSATDSEYNTASSSPVLSGTGLQMPESVIVTVPEINRECGDQIEKSETNYLISEQNLLTKETFPGSNEMCNQLNENNDIEMEMNTAIDLPDNVRLDAKEVWTYGKEDKSYQLYTKLSGIPTYGEEHTSQYQIDDEVFIPQEHQNVPVSTMPGERLPCVEIRNPTTPNVEGSNNRELYVQNDSSPVKIWHGPSPCFHYDYDNDGGNTTVNLMDVTDSEEEIESTETDTMV